MKQFDVKLVFDNETDGEPIYYETDDGKLIFPYEKAYAYDWKDTAGQAHGRKLAGKKSGEVVVLFDELDYSIIYANMKDAKKAK